MTRLRRLTSFLLWLALALSCAAQAADSDRTPPRLSLVDGQASLWRPGAEDWAPARLNMPLAPGDLLYTGVGANLELQIGTRDFIRAEGQTELGLINQNGDSFQVRLTSGLSSLDLRTLAAGAAIELDTPNAAFTIERPGYYRVEVEGDQTHFITRRGGRATIIPAGGGARSIASSEEVVVRGTDHPIVTSYVAPEPDTWDSWNYARTDQMSEAVSSRYLSPGIYGGDALDSYGDWRVVPAYGPVWVPDNVPSGWAPYTTGSWIWDPYYDWTWVDDEPWGWAPFHYGRWVLVNGFWAWAPGPLVVRPAYAPALVAFFYVGHQVSVRIGIGSPAVCWVALGWGEPLLPWWGRHGFTGKPWWGGWGGPHIINDKVISRTASVNVSSIVFQNSAAPNGVVAIHSDRFGRGHIGANRIRTPLPWRDLRETHEVVPLRGALPVQPVARSLATNEGKALRPPTTAFSRPVTGTRMPPPGARLPWREPSQTLHNAPRPEVRVVTPPSPRTPVLTRPPLETERGQERPRPSPPLRLEEMRGAQPAPRVPPQQPRQPREEQRTPQIQMAPRMEAAPSLPRAVEGPAISIPAPRSGNARPRPEEPRREQAFPRMNVPPRTGTSGHPSSSRPEAPMVQQRESRQPAPRMETHPRQEHALPGKPANRLYPRGRGEDGRDH